jgi:chromosomal replication initiation ATPase DnaA
MTGRLPPSAFTVELKDAGSRLRALPVVNLAPPDDNMLRALIVKFCADRQMSVDESVVSFLASRIERSFVAARRAVEVLDAESLRLRRPVTRALASEVLRDAR